MIELIFHSYLTLRNIYELTVVFKIILMVTGDVFSRQTHKLEDRNYTLYKDCFFFMLLVLSNNFEFL